MILKPTGKHGGQSVPVKNAELTKINDLGNFASFSLHNFGTTIDLQGVNSTTHEISCDDVITF